MEDLCNQNETIALDRFNQTRTFETNSYQSNNGAASLLYCNDANDCNSGQIIVSGLRNYYTINASSSLIPATFTTFVVLALISIGLLFRLG